MGDPAEEASVCMRAVFLFLNGEGDVTGEIFIGMGIGREVIYRYSDGV